MTPARSEDAPAIDPQHADQRLACWNALWWSIGNGLVSSTLVVYLALEYGAKGIAISLILAAPKLAGALRMVAPAFLTDKSRRKAFCLQMFAASCGVLLLLPILSAPGQFSPNLSLTLLVLTWTVYHLLEYLAVVALWSWLADMAPAGERGAFLGRRERMLMLGGILGSLAAAGFAAGWNQWPVWTELPPEAWQPWKWLAYAIPAGVGAVVMFASIAPLAFASPCDLPTGISPSEKSAKPVPVAWLPLILLLCFTVWFALSNGVSQAAQGIYPKRVLKIELQWMIAMTVSMQIGQTALAAWVGRLLDRYGNRPILVVSQLLVAVGLLFYAVASPAAPGWIAGAWAFWIAYVGLNVGLPNLLLKLAPVHQRSWWIAGYYSLSGLMFGLGAIFGGMLFDWLSTRGVTWRIGSMTLDHFALLFLVGAGLRAVGALWLAGIVEPRSGGKPPQLREADKSQHR